MNVKEGSHVFRNDLRGLYADLDRNGFPIAMRSMRRAPSIAIRAQVLPDLARLSPPNVPSCFHHAWKDKILQVLDDRVPAHARTPEHVVQEVEWVRDQYGVKEVHFVDDIFNLRTQWVEEFCELYGQRVNLPYSVILQSNLLTEKQAKLMAQSGCVAARVAFESANDRLRNEVLRKGTMRHHLTNSARYIREAGIRLTSLNIIAIPGGHSKTTWRPSSSTSRRRSSTRSSR